MEKTAEFIAYLILALLSGGVSYWRATRRQNQQGRVYQTDKEKLAGENQRLQHQVSDMETILADLRTQVAKLAHYQLLYDTLKEAHEGLKRDHDELKAKFEGKAGEWVTVTGQLATEREMRTALEKQNSDLFDANKALASRVSAYEQAFKLMGQALPKREDLPEPAPEPSETTVDIKEEMQS